MTTAKRPFGFGDERQVAEFFGIPKSEVRKKAVAGEWRSFVIGNCRVFDIDELVDTLTKPQQADFDARIAQHG